MLRSRYAPSGVPGKKRRDRLVMYSRNITKWGPAVVEKLRARPAKDGSQQTSGEQDVVDVYAFQETHRDAEGSAAMIGEWAKVGWNAVAAPAVANKRGARPGGTVVGVRKDLGFSLIAI